MSRFVSKSPLVHVDLGSDEWVKVPAKLSFGFVEEFGDVQTDEKKTEKVVKLLSSVIKEWNLKDEAGAVVPITEASIRDLDMKTALVILEKATKMLEVPKA